MGGQVSGEAAVELAYTACAAGKRDASAVSERMRMNVAPGVAFDFILHGQVTPDRLRRAAHLMQVMADVLSDDDAQPKVTTHD